MLTYLTPADDTAEAVAEAEWAERRQALCIRPLIEHAGLRETLGLAPITPSAAHAAKRMPSNASAPASNRRTKHASKKTSKHAGRAFR